MVVRNYTVDLMRSLAIFLMMIFHFIYDLKYFDWVTWNISDANGWNYFRNVILTLFFLCIGISLTYKHAKTFDKKSFFYRLLKVSSAALLVTIMSLFMFPRHWIFFGVLHFIVVACLFAAPFIKLPKTSALVGFFILLLGIFGDIPKRWPFYYISDSLPLYGKDFVSLFPWLGVILLGITLGHSDFFNRNSIKASPLINRLTIPGKHSLAIYLLHQPLFFAIFGGIEWLSH